ncbi:MAG: sigma-54 dependent transcriptional regulator [Pseudomonadota bacterium]
MSLRNPDGSGAPIFIVDDEAALRRSLSQWLALGGFRPESFADGTAAFAAIEAAGPNFGGALVTDLRMPGLDGIALLERIRAFDPDLPVVLLTAHGDVPVAVQAMRLGAYDFVEKPFDPDRLTVLLRRATEARALTLENRRLRAAAHGAGEDATARLSRRLIGTSEPMRRLRAAVLEAAGSHASVLVTGETGSGKELIAQNLHAFSPRAGGPFVAVNCAAVPDTLIEAEFLGHESGAFTGAGKAREGWFEAARGGTLFLDELGALPAQLQPVLLRVLQEREVTRIGARRATPVDVRVIAASNEPPDVAVRAGRLRPDLLFRLNTLEIEAPPLRARRGDIALLFESFAAQIAEREGAEVPMLGPADAAALAAHDWPGNVRELLNIAERAVLRARRGAVDIAALLGLPTAHGEVEAEAGGLRERMEAAERAILSEALSRHGGSIAGAMAELGLPRRTMNEKMARHGLTRREFAREQQGTAEGLESG